MLRRSGTPPMRLSADRCRTRPEACKFFTADVMP
jgi:hypothetical protein